MLKQQELVQHQEKMLANQKLTNNNREHILVSKNLIKMPTYKTKPLFSFSANLHPNRAFPKAQFVQSAYRQKAKMHRKSYVMSQDTHVSVDVA